MTTRHRWTASQRLHIARRDLFLCRYCNRIIWPWQDADVAHEVSVKNGGGDELSNVAWSHASCNRSAGAEDMPMSKRLDTVTLIILSFAFVLSVFFLIMAIA